MALRRRGARRHAGGRASPRGGAPKSPPARSSTPPGRGSNEFLTASTPTCRSRPPAPGQGQPHRRAALFDHDHAYIFQNPDRRIIFAIPYERDFTLIGTTDVEHHGAIGEATSTRRDRLPVRAGEPLFRSRCRRPTWSGPTRRAPVARRRSRRSGGGDARLPARPRYAHGGAPLLTVCGGKITTFRRLAEEAADLLARAARIRAGAWTHDALLPGGDLSAWIASRSVPTATSTRPSDSSRLSRAAIRRCRRRYAGASPAATARASPARRRRRSRRRSRARAVRGRAALPARSRMGRSADDVLWRRTKLGLHYTPAERAAVAAWCTAHWPDVSVWCRSARTRAARRRD